jgi:hypothetical protein
MRGKPALRSVCVAVALLGFLAVGCEKDYRQIVVVNGDKTDLVTWGPAPKRPQKLWAKGRTVVFRTDSDFPGIPQKVHGKAGRIYRVNDDFELEEVGEFALTMPDDTLAYQYGK